MPHDTVTDVRSGRQAAVKRWPKEKVFARLPGRARTFACFFYRYVIRLGVLGRPEVSAFHFFERSLRLVGANLVQVKPSMAGAGCDVVEPIERVLGIKVGR